MNYDISRFIEAQRSSYQQALSEIKNGKKASHWIWYIFPQIKGLGRSAMSEYYGIQDIDEAKRIWRILYLANALSKFARFCYLSTQTTRWK